MRLALSKDTFSNVQEEFRFTALLSESYHLGETAFCLHSHHTRAARSRGWAEKNSSISAGILSCQDRNSHVQLSLLRFRFVFQLQAGMKSSGWGNTSRILLIKKRIIRHTRNNVWFVQQTIHVTTSVCCDLGGAVLC